MRWLIVKYFAPLGSFFLVLIIDLPFSFFMTGFSFLSRETSTIGEKSYNPFIVDGKSETGAHFRTNLWYLNCF